MKLAGIFNFEHRYSATSGVAGLLNDGTTIHHLLAQNGELSSQKPNITKIRQRNGNAQVILVDEVKTILTRDILLEKHLLWFISMFLMFTFQTNCRRLACWTLPVLPKSVGGIQPPRLNLNFRNYVSGENI